MIDFFKNWFSAKNVETMREEQDATCSEEVFPIMTKEQWQEWLELTTDTGGEG